MSYPAHASIVHLEWHPMMLLVLYTFGLEQRTSCWVQYSFLCWLQFEIASEQESRCNAAVAK